MLFRFLLLCVITTLIRAEEIEILPMMDDTTVVVDNQKDVWTPVKNKTDKLDDVSSLDIAKEKRRQRQEKKEEANSDDTTPTDTKTDTITVKGAVLQGQVTELNSDYLEFNLIYGKGSIQIKYEDIEQLSTEHQYHIFYKGKETTGQIVSIKEHAFLIIKHGDIEETIKISNIDRFLISTRENNTLENRFRNFTPYTRGNVDLGFEYESGTNVKHKASATIHLERKMMQYRSTFDLVYEYETTQTAGSPDQLNKNEYILFYEQDYYLSEGDFAYGQIGYDFDEPRGIQGRTYPALGAGHRFGEDRDTWVQIKAGGGYVHERFFTYPDNNYFSGFVGVGASYKFEERSSIQGLILKGDIFYMPSIMDAYNDWLARFQASAELPIGSTLSLKWVVRSVNDDNPSPEVGNNKFTTDFYLSFVF